MSEPASESASTARPRMRPTSVSEEEHELAARVVSALLRENYGGLAGHVTRGSSGAVLRLPGGDRAVALEPDGFTADLRVVLARGDDPLDPPMLTLDEVRDAVAVMAGERDAVGAAAFDAECRRTLAETRLRARHQRTAVRGREPDYEALAAGLPHPVYPASPCRLGLTDADLVRYAPEFSPSFELRWAAVPKHLVTRSAAEAPAWWPSPERVGLPASMTATHDLFPVHPLTAREILPAGKPLFPGKPPFSSKPLFSRKPLFSSKALFAAGEGDRAPDATLAPRPCLEVRPTLSVRTVAVAGHPDWHVKLPLPASTLGAGNRRSIVPGTLADGALVCRMLQALEVPGLLVADDTRYAHAGRPDLGCLLRRLPPGLGEREVVPVAALTARLPDGRTVFEKLAGKLAGSRGPGPVMAFAQEYFRLILGVATALLVRHGIALESHQQNAALVIRPGQPLRLLVKDFDGTLLRRDRISDPGRFTDRRMLTDSDDALADVFVTITVHLCVGAVAFGLARAGAAPLQGLLGAARRALAEALDSEGDAPAAKLLRVRVLEAGRLTGKSMITAGTLTSKEHTGAADINKYYGITGPNYLREIC